MDKNVETIVDFIIKIKAGFDPSQPRADDGTWGSGSGVADDSIDSSKPTAQEKQCIENYTDRGFHQVNHYLGKGEINVADTDFKGNKEDFTDKISKQAQCIESGISKLPKFEGTVYRGDTIKTDSINSFKDNLDNNDIQFKAFLSTSQDKDTAEGFMLARANETKVLYIIQSKNGRDLYDYSMNETESEVLFKPNTKFSVTSYRIINGIIYVKIKEL